MRSQFVTSSELKENLDICRKILEPILFFKKPKMLLKEEET